MKVFRTCPCDFPGPPGQIIIGVLLLRSSEAGVDPVNLISGQRYSFGDNPIEALHGNGLDPPEPLDIKDSPEVCEDDSSLTPDGAQVSLSEKRLKSVPILRDS
jgi:hypothetical protein